MGVCTHPFDRAAGVRGRPKVVHSSVRVCWLARRNALVCLFVHYIYIFFFCLLVLVAGVSRVGEAAETDMKYLMFLVLISLGIISSLSAFFCISFFYPTLCFLLSYFLYIIFFSC